MSSHIQLSTAHCCLSSMFATKLTDIPGNIDPSTHAQQTDRQSFPAHQSQTDRQRLTICSGQKNNWDPDEPPARPRYRSHKTEPDYDSQPEGLHRCSRLFSTWQLDSIVHKTEGNFKNLGTSQGRCFLRRLFSSAVPG